MKKVKMQGIMICGKTYEYCSQNTCMRHECFLCKNIPENIQKLREKKRKEEKLAKQASFKKNGARCKVDNSEGCDPSTCAPRAHEVYGECSTKRAIKKAENRKKAEEAEAKRLKALELEVKNKKPCIVCEKKVCDNESKCSDIYQSYRMERYAYDEMSSRCEDVGSNFCYLYCNHKSWCKTQKYYGALQSGFSYAQIAHEEEAYMAKLNGGGLTGREMRILIGHNRRRRAEGARPIDIDLIDFEKQSGLR